MAANSEHLTFQSFVKQAQFWFEKSYPDYKNAFFNESIEELKETICIPDALEVLPNRRLETYRDLPAGNEKAKHAFDSDIIGQRGENKFFSAFRQLKLGGILIAGFNTKEFFVKKVDENCNEEWSTKNIEHFECDALFIHQKLGFFVIECKGTQDHRMVSQRFDCAVRQLKKIILGMHEIYRQTTATECPFDIHGVVCFSNVNINKPDQNDFKVLGKSDIDGAEFRQFWLQKTAANSELLEFDNKQSNRNPVSDKNLLAFIASIAGYRSAKFVNLPSNALEIYRIIDEQEFPMKSRRRKDKEAVKTYSSLPLTTKAIILNQEQLNAVECTEQHVLISGPPGTGKTTVMLLRALHAATELDKPGCVFIIEFGSGFLAPLYQKFIDENRSEAVKRKIIVQHQRSEGEPAADFVKYGPDDDVFCDEDSSYLRNPLRDRPQATGTGRTTIVITGRNDPSEIAATPQTLVSFPGFHHLPLNTVFRGTLSIIEMWKHSFPERLIVPGHNIMGAPVERVSITLGQVLATTEQKVSVLLKAGLSPRHLAVIVIHHFNAVSHIKRHLKSKEFPCGTVAEQVNNPGLIAVTDVFEALSYEWPVVIFIVSHNQMKKYPEHPHVLIAMSRCIAKLILFEYKLMGSETAIGNDMAKQTVQHQRLTKRRYSKIKCHLCNQNSTEKSAIQCIKCDSFWHKKCLKASDEVWKWLQTSGHGFTCSDCMSEKFPKRILRHSNFEKTENTTEYISMPGSKWSSSSSEDDKENSFAD